MRRYPAGTGKPLLEESERRCLVPWGHYRLVGLSMKKLKAYPKARPVLEQAKQEFYLRRKMRKKPKLEDKSSQF
jgi:hypothetical protein